MSDSQLTTHNSKLITLCMIVGNVEEYIARCLESFRPIADEICVVRAIGCAAPDRTLEIAEKQFGARVAEYRNHPGHEDWTHIDDFAAARQQSFDLATGDYCFWCDSDDILKTGADKIRRHADQGGYACFIFPYDVFGKNVIVPRERMMLRDSGRWEYPVHECFRFKIEPVTAAMDDGVVIQHLPRLDKSGGNQRNLRILESIPEDKMSVGLKYHLFGELMCAGRKNEAIALAIKLLTEAQLGKDERYDLLMSLVLQTKDLQRQTDLLHEAHKVDPQRREALGVLSCVMMDLGKPESALAYARQMIATRAPDIQSWNSRQHFYTYTGDDIYQQALRVNGLYREAEIVRSESLKRAGGPRIALLHATRGRPEQASKCRKAWHDLAAQPGRVEHIFAFDDDDAESRILRRFNHVVVIPGGSCVSAWNLAAALTSAPVIVQLSDDWIPLPKWDDLICDRIGDVTKPAVLAISDGFRTDQLLCMAICTRAYLLIDYFLFHPDFTGVYSDNWFTEQAYERGLVIEARDIVFTHNHPAAGKVPMDKTYIEQNAPARYEQGLAVIEKLRRGTDWTSVPGFFNFWTFYGWIARELKDGDTICEVGVWLGRSIIYLAQLLQRAGKRVNLIAVDHFRGETNQLEHQATVELCGGSIRSAFEANIARCGVADMIRILDGDSASVASQVPNHSLAFCFIDAAHDYASVKLDLAAWKDKVRPGGILAGHDFQWPEVNKAVREEFPAVRDMGAIWMQKL